LNVFHISIITHEKLSQDDLTLVEDYFSNFVNNTSLTNFIIREYILEDLYDYDDEDKITFFNRMLSHIGSDEIKELDNKNWIYLSQD
ncbi:terpinolene synthase, partial [Bacillus stratosphericus]